MIYISKLLKVASLTVGLGTFLFAPSVSAQQHDPCLNLQSQDELSACEGQQYKKADAELNQVYRQLRAKYQSNPAFLEKLKLSQEAWLKFRDADLDAVYYQQDKLKAYGSAYPMCRAMLMTLLTVERTKELRRMLNPEEGDVCGFSAPEKPASDPR